MLMINAYLCFRKGGKKNKSFNPVDVVINEFTTIIDNAFNKTKGG